MTCISLPLHKKRKANCQTSQFIETHKLPNFQFPELISIQRRSEAGSLTMWGWLVVHSLSLTCTDLSPFPFSLRCIAHAQFRFKSQFFLQKSAKLQVVAPSYIKRMELGHSSNMWAWFTSLVVSDDTRKSRFKSLFWGSMRVKQEFGHSFAIEAAAVKFLNTSDTRTEELILSKAKVVV